MPDAPERTTIEGVDYIRAEIDRLQAELRGKLTVWESEGGFGASDIQIGGVSIEAWLADQMGIPITPRGNAEQGEYGEIILTVRRQ